MEHQRPELLPFRRRAAQSLDVAQSNDALNLFPPESPTVSHAPAPPADPLGDFSGEAATDHIRAKRLGLSAGEYPSQVQSSWESMLAIFGVLLGLILASIYLAVR
jgi:hypothetical protein